MHMCISLSIVIQFVNPQTKNLEFGGFDSSRFSNPRGWNS